MTSTATPAKVAAGLSGRLMGGNQPVAFAQIFLYAPGTTGYGSAATPILNQPVSSDQNGDFTLTGEFTCPSASSDVYMVVRGGNPGLAAGTNNTALAMMALLGPCGDLQPTSFIVINELTTVAAVWTMAPFMVDAEHIGTSPTNVQGLMNAMAIGANLVNSASGSTPGANVPSIATIPSAAISSLGNILSACINTDGSTSASAPCGRLFSAVTPNGSVEPADTIAAALDIALNPGHNVSQIFGLATSSPPFQPALTTTPNDWTLAVSYAAPALQHPADLAVDQQGNVWVVSSPNGVTSTVSVLNAGGIVASYPQSGAYYGHLALDAYGDPWLTDTTNSDVLELTSGGTRASSNPFTGGGIYGPGALAFDATGDVWIANSGPTVSELSANGSALSPASTGYGTFGSSGPGGLALDTAGKVWIADSAANAVEVLGSGGQQVAGSPYTGGGLDGPYAIAIDTAGGAWVANRIGSSLTRISSSGGAISGSPFYGGGLSSPIAISLDGLADVWVVNSGSNSVSEFLNNGLPQSGAAGYGSTSLLQPYKLALDGSGNVWVANLGTVVAGTGTVTQIVGVANPVATPLALAMKESLLDQRP